MFLDWKAQYFENEYPTAHIQCNPYQITNFSQNSNKKFSVLMETLKKKNRFGGINLPDYSHQDSMALAQKQKYKPVEYESPDTYGYLIFDKGVKNTWYRKSASSISGAGKTGQLHVKE